jgi:hypothetical protein
MNAIWEAPGRFRPAPTVRRMRLGGRSLLFCERRQQLFELNPTADLIWAALLEESPPRAARLLLDELGAAAEEVPGHVWDQLERWLAEGLWEPAEARAPGPGAEGSLRLAIERVRAEIRCGDPKISERLRSVFAPFPGFAGAPTLRIGIAPWPGGLHLFEDDTYLGAIAAEEAVPRLKALLTERVTGRRFDGFFAHGALLAKGPVLAMLSGPPGAGKTTLALALRAAGWSLLGDDLIRVDAAARFRGVPFAPAVKEGAWPLLQAFTPDLMQWPIERRGDGQAVRYAPMAAPAQKPRTPDLFIALAREVAAPALAQPLGPVAALTTLLGEAFSARGRISADLMAKLAAGFQGVACRRLVYSALPEAALAVEATVRAL